MTDITVSVTLTVKHEHLLRQAVRQQLLDAHIDAQDADPFLDHNLIPITEVARLAIDTGETPVGCEVHDSWAEIERRPPMHGIVAQLLDGTETPGAYLEACRVRLGRRDPCVVQNIDFQGPVVWIAWIEANTKGAGKKLMERVCANADQRGILLVASMEDNGSGKLRAWYEQFGFTVDEAGWTQIERLPRALASA